METKTTGRDSHGNAVTLGGRDTDNVPVGFIDGDGLGWESVRERDLAVTAGRYLDAMIAWKRDCGGEIVRRGADGSVTILYPNPWAIAKAVCLDPANVNDAADNAVSDYLFEIRLRRAARRR